MNEIDSFGYLADCALLFAQHGGELTDAHWELICRSADFIVSNWEKPEAGIWELMPEQHFVATKIMCWVTLDRALSIAGLLGRKAPSGWRSCRDQVHAEVMDKGWCERTGSFRQRYGSEALDGALLLIPLMGFLPADHDRVRGTVNQVAAVLRINGLVHRFVPERTPGRPDKPMGDKEGSFLMCNFWLAQAWKMMGEPEKAEAVLARAEACTGGTGLFSEAGDSRHPGPPRQHAVAVLSSRVRSGRARARLTALCRRCERSGSLREGAIPDGPIASSGVYLSASVRDRRVAGLVRAAATFVLGGCTKCVLALF